MSLSTAIRIVIVVGFMGSTLVAASMIASAVWVQTAPQSKQTFKSTSSIPNNGYTMTPALPNTNHVLELWKSGVTVRSENVSTNAAGEWVFQFDPNPTWQVGPAWSADVYYNGTLVSWRSFDVVQ